MSPYLFIICADVLSGMLKKDELSKDIHGAQVVRKAPIISHLFFTDDILLFVRANTEEVDRIMQVLSRYQKAYGKVVNIDKSEVSLSGNMGEDSKEMIHNILGFKAVIRHSKYLGLHVVFGRLKKEVFKLVIDGVCKKVKRWKEGFLYRAGKEVPIKTIAQSIPTYIMSCYKIPDQCCKEIKFILAKFLWGSKKGRVRFTG